MRSLNYWCADRKPYYVTAWAKSMKIEQDATSRQAKILIVDDNVRDGEWLKGLLIRVGHSNVQVINSVKLFLSMSHSHSFDIIFFDFRMFLLERRSVTNILVRMAEAACTPVLMVQRGEDRDDVPGVDWKMLFKPFDEDETANHAMAIIEAGVLRGHLKNKNDLLRECENSLALIINTISEGVIIANKAGRIKTFSRVAERIFGYKAENVMDRSIGKLFPETFDVDDMTKRLIHLAKDSSGTDFSPLLGLHSNGEMLPIDVFVSEASCGGSSLFVMLCRDATARRAEDILSGTTMDVSELRVVERTSELMKANAKLKTEINVRKKAEKELAAARDRAIETSRLKSEFLANVSHEIRTPLNGMLGMLSILAESDLQGEYDDYVQTAYRSGEILLNQINELLDFSKVEAGKIDLEYIAYDPSELVDNVLQLFDEQVASKQLSISKNISSCVPDQVMGDPWRVRQIIINLLGNAIKFTQQGGVAVTLKLVREGETHCVLRFEVSDTGLGISVADQDRIFDSFTQADGSTTRRFGGTGLGLTISKKLVELMGGEMGVESQLGEGSTFWFTLSQGKQTSIGDLQAADETQEKTGVISTTPGNELSHDECATQKRLRVLVVEDNEINQKVATKMLMKLNSDVDVVGDGAVALDAVKAKHYDLVLMDCLMPVMDGYECTHRIRLYEKSINAKKRLPIIAMSANVRKKDQDKCYASGMDDFLSKPVTLDAIRGVISKWMCES